MTTPSSLSRLSEAPLIVVDGVTVWRPEDQEDPLIKIEVGGSVHVRKASEWHALAVASFALSETAMIKPQERCTDPTIEALAKAAGWVGVADPLRYLERYIARTEKLAGRKVMVDGMGGVFNVPGDRDG
jgi:hypothetical protein